MNINQYKKEFENIKSFVELITTRGGIRNNSDKKEKWASFKRENESIIRKLLNITPDLKDNPCNVISFDIDEEKDLLLLNYTSQAHNVLHVYDKGWSSELKLCRGLVFSFKDNIKLVSRGFEKFFNANETRRSLYEELISKYNDKTKFNAYEKIDGHMIEYFEYDNDLCATTRGKFNTASAQESLSLMTKEEWLKCKSYLKRKYDIELMTIVCELVTPSSKVLVDYFNKENIYILALYDIKGNKIDYKYLEEIASLIKNAKVPETKTFSMIEMFQEVARRDVDNHEGWVLDLNGVLLKFKYNNYIGMMVSNKMCYKYLMQTMLNQTTTKMVSTLSKEKVDEVSILLSNINIKTEECKKQLCYKPLYSLWSDDEGSLNYFRLVCRKFYRDFIACNLI